METKKCTKCGVDKPLSAFYRVRGNDGYRSHCKECISEHQKQKYKNDPEYKEYKNSKTRHKWIEDPELWSKRQLAVRKSHLKRKYNMTLEQYARMFDEQKECCAICGEHYTKVPHQQLMVDHCHTTGKVRQLLCDLCNTALGKFKDSPELLERAADYIRKHNGNFVAASPVAD